MSEKEKLVEIFHDAFKAALTEYAGTRESGGFYIRWGFDQPKAEIKAGIPTLEEISANVLLERRRKLATELTEKGQADLFVDGLTRGDVKTLIQECFDKKLSVFVRTGKPYIGAAEIRVGTYDCPYTQEYFNQIFSVDAALNIKGLHD